VYLIQRRKTLSAALVILVLFATGCPSSTDLDNAAKASNELAHDVLLANRFVAEFYTAGKIPLAAKDRIADKLGVIGDKGEKFNNILIELDKKYPQGTLPPQDAQFVRDNLSELQRLYTDILADLLPFKAQKAVSELGKDLSTIEKVVIK
jgi:hypothetical protein